MGRVLLARKELWLGEQTILTAFRTTGTLRVGVGVEGCLAEVKKEALCTLLRWMNCRLANWPEARQPQGADLGASCHYPVARSQLPCHCLCTALSFPQGSAAVPAQRSSSFLIKKQLMGTLLPDSYLLPLLGPALKALPWDVATVMSTPHL